MDSLSVRSVIGSTLRGVGIYREVKKAQRLLSDPIYRWNWIDTERDLSATRKAIGAFMCTGADRADPKKQVLIISTSDLPVLVKFHALFAKALQLRGYSPVILTKSYNKIAQRYFALFGFGRKNLLFWDHYVSAKSPSDVEIGSIVVQFLSDRPTVNEIKDWKFHGVRVGRHALSWATRTRLQGQFDLSDSDNYALFRQYFEEATRSVLVAERLFGEYHIHKMLVRDAGYIPNGDIYEVGLSSGVDGIRMEMGQRRGSWLFKRYTADTIGQALFSISAETWEHIRDTPLTREQKKELDANFAERYDPDSLTDVNLYQAGKRLVPVENVRNKLDLDPKKKTAVVFSHISWDASFFDGEDIYDDYEQWLVETTRIACLNPNLNWVIKLHPANVFKLKRENGVTEETEMTALRKLGELPDHVKVLRANTEINTQSLFPIMDYCLTVRGTIGMETPCIGVPALTAGTGRYDGYGFTIDSRTRREYEQKLLSLHTIPRVSPEQTEFALRHAYWALVRRQTSFDDVAEVSMRPVSEAKNNLHQNARILVRSLSELECAASIEGFSDWVLDGSSPDLIL